MTANVEAMVRAGVEAYRAGKKAEARTLLEKVLELDEYNEQAWLWLSAVVETPEEKRTCLENVLVINPRNDNARTGLKSLGVDPDAGAGAPPVASGASPFTDMSFIDEGRTPAFDENAWDDADVPPTASSAASSSSFRGAQHSSSDYDNWIDSMGLGGKKTTRTNPAAGPFGAPDLGIEDTGLFGADDDDEDEAVPPPLTTRSSARSPAVYDEEDVRAGMFDEDDDFLASDAVEDFNAALEEEDDTDLDELLTKTGAGLEVMSSTGKAAMAAASSEPDPQELFAMIPKEIEATRLPGEDEESPRLLLIGVVALVVLNIGALLFLLSQMA